MGVRFRERGFRLQAAGYSKNPDLFLKPEG
jgi:hypothetical protein